MNPETNRFETLASQISSLEASPQLFRPNGQPVPETWTQFQIGETVVVKNYTFRVAYIGETAILFEPVGPVLVGQEP